MVVLEEEGKIAAVLAALEKEHKSAHELGYLSTHPATAERIRAAEEASR